jgi:hypothetical protein
MPNIVGAATPTELHLLPFDVFMVMVTQLRKTVPPLHFFLPVNTITLIVLGDRLGPLTGAAAMQVNGAQRYKQRACLS